MSGRILLILQLCKAMSLNTCHKGFGLLVLLGQALRSFHKLLHRQVPHRGYAAYISQVHHHQINLRPGVKSQDETWTPTTLN